MVENRGGGRGSRRSGGDDEGRALHRRGCVSGIAADSLVSWLG